MSANAAASGSAPQVSVLMTTFNNEGPTLKRAIDSILAQTCSDLEFIVIFEPGDKNFALIRDSYSDPRLILIENAERLGRSRSYNAGLDISRGKYLARMDADDVCVPDRLERQIDFLKQNPGISVVSSHMRLLDEAGAEVGIREFPAEPAAIERAFCFTNPICHPTVVWDWDRIGRGERFDLHFSAHCDDLELWLRLLERGHKFANIPAPLLDYRIYRQYSRSRENWQYNVRARMLHWRLAFKHPLYVVGLTMIGVLSVLPEGLIKRLTSRNFLSDLFRSVKSSPLAKGK